MNGNSIEIYCLKSKVADGREGWDWAWQDSLEKKVFGWSPSLENIKKRATRMFPNHQIQLNVL
jgi:hypothetical protein